MYKLQLASFLDCGFVIPLEAEAAPLIKKLEEKRDFQYGSRKIILGKLINKNICLIISGCGKIKASSATQLLIDKYPAKIYINYGTACSFTSKLKIIAFIELTDIN